MYDLLKFGDKNDYLNSEEYIFYVTLLHDSEQVDDILGRALDRLPESFDLWVIKLNRSVARKDENSEKVLLSAHGVV